MADFSSLSSPESDDSAIENIISQAIDLSVLEQIAALNSPHSSDTALPTHLETRFHRLKSFPASVPNLKTHPPSLSPEKSKIPKCQNQPTKSPTSSPHKDTSSPHKDTELPSPKSELDSLDRCGSSPFPSIPVKSEDVKGLNPKSGTGSTFSPSISSCSSAEPSSPPRLTCCFWRSPKKVHKKKSKEDGMAGFDLDDGFWGKDDEMLSDLSAFSLKEQRRRLRKAWKEEEKVNREAEKVVKWAKQVSARMDASMLDSPTSDEEKFK
ncbi:uncharacterized protein LOC131232638 [Magnolia sinica]|uniref:uncharacterized protein LOC131232638 n=1 Tax=Magnolia sinica TaxID=86752 RepID=UPI002659AD81|nr:uncharacterized protein LOC131232638 [Magnolia sinica]